jgi:chromosome segregation ATPase
MLVLGAVGLAPVLAGIIGVWVVNLTTTDFLTVSLDAVMTPLEQAEASLQEVNATLGSAQQSVEELRIQTETIGQTIQADSRLLEGLGSLVGEDLTGAIDRALQAVEQAQTTVAMIDGILQGLEDLSLITVPDWARDLPSAIDELRRAGQQVQETLDVLQAFRLGAIEKAVTSVTEKAAVMETRLAEVQSRTASAQAEVTKLLSTMQNWRADLPRVIDLVSILLTLLLLLMGFGQGALVSLGWSFLKVGAWVPFYPLNKAVQPT